jgi:hypothetical protein
MNYYETLTQLAIKHQQRKPGSPGAAAVIAALKSLTSTWNVNLQAAKVSGCQFQNSLWKLAIIGLVAFLSGFVFPLLSLGGAILLDALLLRELSHPWLGRTKDTAENLLLNLPAKNKEAQKIFLVAVYDTEPFMKTPFALKPRLYLTLLLGFSAAMVITSVLYLLRFGPLFNCLNLILLLLIVFLNLSVKKPESRPATLKNCAAILEAAAILNKVKPDITSLALCFVGSQSLNSGIAAFNQEFTKGPKDLTYLVNLVESTDNTVATMQCPTSEGMLPGKPASAILLSMMQEVAREKNLTLTTAKTSEYTVTDPLNRAKIQPITLVIPKNESVSPRDVRELLCGLIRKLDH